MSPRRRFVLTFLTPYAPGVAPDTPIGGAGRCLSQYSVTADQALSQLVDRLGRPPGELTVRAMELGDVALIARMPPDAPRYLNPGTLQPLAFVAVGLTAGEAMDALAGLAAAA